MQTHRVQETKSDAAAWAFWVLGLVGIAGIHRLYLGRPVSGIVWLLTGGLCMIGTIVDAFLLPGMIRDAQT